MDTQKRPDSFLGMSPLGFARHVLLFLFVRRWYYLLAGVLMAAAFYLLMRENLPMPSREYFVTYRVKYSDPSIGVSELRGETYRPDWAMTNPFSREMAIKFFESTRIVMEAGERINYSVNYRAKGKDIYDSIPVDVRFLSERDIFDSWTATLHPQTDGVLLSKLRGKYLQQPIPDTEDIFIPYDTEVNTPVGIVRATRTEHPLSLYPVIRLSKMSDVLTQDRYDKHMLRYMGGNLIELFLTASCTEKFAEDLFREMGNVYSEYARNHYQTNLRDYLERLSSAIEQVKTGKDSIAGGIEVSPASRQAMIAQLETLAEQARANAVILEQQDMLEQLDPLLLRSTRQSDDGRPFLYLMMVLCLVLTPLLLLTIELTLRRRVMNRTFLMETLWPSARLLGSLPRLHKPNPKLNIAVDAMRIRLDAECLSRGASRVLIASTEHREGVSTVANLLAASYDRLMAKGDSGTRPTLSELPSLSDSSELLETMQCAGTLLVLVVRPGYARIAEVKALRDHCAYLGIHPLIVWNDVI